jgi:acetyl-CoA C-acetyltransferase/acetyl-CoA acyltransferase
MKAKKVTQSRTLALVAGCRTPFARAGTELRGAHAADLAAHVFRELLDRTGLEPGAIDEVILGCAGPDAREANVARVAALRAGVPVSVPAVTVMRNCASGMEALFAAQTRLRAGEGEVFLLGGAESMSNFPLLMGPQLVAMFERLAKSRSALARLRALASFRPRFLAPRIAVKEGLSDPITGLTMGMTAENVARRFSITREEQDRFALRSHQNATAAREAGRLAEEIAPLAAPPRFAAMVADDNGIRREQSLDALARLRPVFDRREGDVTVGNACQITDGAVALLAMSQAKAKALGLRPLALLRGHACRGLDPAHMGLGPVHAAPAALADAGLALRDMERVEINEAFAGQVLGCLRAFASERYCRDEVGLPAAPGDIDPLILNANGGAIALGHPIAATGARLVLTLALELRRKGLQFGLATLCIGGGQGQAIVLEAA